MNWQIEMVSSRNGKAFEWTVTKGVNRHGDGPEATVCKVTSGAEDAALIAAAPEMYAELELLANEMIDIDRVTIARRIEKLLTKVRGEK